MVVDIWTQRRKDVRDEHIRFQPVILVVRDGRLECSCGAIATFVDVKLREDGGIEGYVASCHDCYCKEDEQNE